MAIFFISYSHKNNRFVDELEIQLQNQGFAYWIDHKIIPGEDWRKAIDDAIKASQGIILVVSKESMQSNYVTYEWSFGMGNDKPVIPLLIEDFDDVELHPKLESQQLIHFYPEKRDWTTLFQHLEALSGNLPDFPPAIQNAVDLFDSVEPSDWDKAVSLLKNNRSEYSIEALASGCEHDTQAVRSKCALVLAPKSDYRDERCKPVILEVLKSNAEGETPSLNKNFLDIAVRMHFSEAEGSIFEFIKRNKHQSFNNLKSEHFEYIIQSLNEIISPAGVDDLFFVLKRDIASDNEWYKRLSQVLLNNGGHPPNN